MWDEKELAKAGHAVPFPMLADPCGNIGRLFGTFSDEIMLNLRGSFLIDPDGIVQVTKVFAAPVGRNYDEDLREIKAFQYVRENNGQATPAGWAPGKSTLKPGPELVGKVLETWTP